MAKVRLAYVEFGHAHEDCDGRAVFIVEQDDGSSLHACACFRRDGPKTVPGHNNGEQCFGWDGDRAAPTLTTRLVVDKPPHPYLDIGLEAGRVVLGPGCALEVAS